MKVCFLIADITSRGGTERVTTIIANGLVEKGLEAGIISCRGKGSSFFFLNENVKTHFLSAEGIKNPIKRKFSNVSAIKKCVEQNHYDVLVAVDIYLYLYLFPLQMKRKCKCVAWDHFNYYISSHRGAKLAKILAAKYADKVVVLGKNDLQNYRSHFKRAKNLTCIYNPVAFQKTEYKNPHVHRVIAAGNLTEAKGFDLLIDAWNLIEKNKKLEQDWKLDIFGNGEQKEMLQSKIRGYGLKRVTLKGYANNLEAELMNSAVFVLSSRHEGFVLALLEAQAKGLPCVSFNCKESPAEIIDDGVNGFLVEEGNIEQLAEKMGILMNDSALRIKFASESQKDLGRFEPERVIEQWETLLYQLLGGR